MTSMWRFGWLASVPLLAACGGTESMTAPPSADNTPASIAVSAGGGETVRVGTAVATAPAVVVRNASGNPVAGVSVTFAVTAGGGTITGASATTNTSGVAAVGSWTLGPTPGGNTLTATVQGLTAVTFTDTARWPYWTFMVYMAADNDLAIQGIFDIDEMEAAGVDPEVQVVVQAEFSPINLDLLAGCDASCFNRPNFNTFRYFVAGEGQDVTGPNGSATDVGNRDMTNPAELNEFITWAKQNYPAEHYALVLWNHGGGYTGLLQDITSAGSGLMSIGDLPTALTGVGPIDLLDFDMCLMAGYETLIMVNGFADYVVFSEELVPGAGNPYKELIDGIQATSAADARTIAEVFVDQFDAAYQSDRASTTKSAYEMSGFAAFETALDNVAQTLRTNVGVLATAFEAAAAGSQKYARLELTDLVNFFDSVRVRTSDATLQSQIDAVKSEATGSFRVRNRFRNGTAVGFGGESDVSRSTGLHIVMPSGIGNDQLADAGPGSFTAYEALYGGKPWTLFLADWIASQATLAFTDQGNARFQGYLVWDPAAVSGGADVDLWILEPDGNLFIPWLGSVTPNGTFTNDSYDDGTFYEGYTTNRYVQNGTYKFYANLWTDPNDLRPEYDLLSRSDQVSPLTSLYDPNFPQLSTQVSWLSDLDPTFQELEANAYTDLQFFATLTYGPSPSPMLSAAGVEAAQPLGGEAAATAILQPTPAQLLAVREVLARRRPGAASLTPSRAPSFIRVPEGWKQK